jgi:RTA1 like protein
VFFVVQYFFIVVAPVLFSASIYAVLSVLISRVGRQYSPLPPKIILWTFIASDIVATVIQIVGSALIGVHESKRQDPTSANNILLGGLSVQVFSFFIYVILFTVFIWRAREVLFFRKRQSGQTNTLDSIASQDDGEKTSIPTAVQPEHPVSLSFLAALCVATLAVYLRTCYRLSETAQKNYGSKAHNVKEGYFGGLEFAPIIVCVYSLVIWHPGRYLSRKSAIS